jgi:hypothetical protein
MVAYPMREGRYMLKDEIIKEIIENTEPIHKNVSEITKSILALFITYVEEKKKGVPGMKTLNFMQVIYNEACDDLIQGLGGKHG